MEQDHPTQVGYASRPTGQVIRRSTIPKALPFKLSGTHLPPRHHLAAARSSARSERVVACQLMAPCPGSTATPRRWAMDGARHVEVPPAICATAPVECDQSPAQAPRRGDPRYRWDSSIRRRSGRRLAMAPSRTCTRWRPSRWWTSAHVMKDESRHVCQRHLQGLPRRHAGERSSGEEFSGVRACDRRSARIANYFGWLPRRCESSRSPVMKMFRHRCSPRRANIRAARVASRAEGLRAARDHPVRALRSRSGGPGNRTELNRAEDGGRRPPFPVWR